MLKRGAALLAAFGVTALAACGGGQYRFEGSWQRVGLLDSTISLREAEDGFHFRWKLSDGIRTISCPEDDFCEEFRDGDRVYEYRFRIERAAGGDELIVRAEGRPLTAEMQPVTWVDRMVLREGGRELWAYLLAMNGEDMKTPVGPIQFVRISETPF